MPSRQRCIRINDHTNYNLRGLPKAFNMGGTRFTEAYEHVTYISMTFFVLK